MVMDVAPDDNAPPEKQFKIYKVWDTKLRVQVLTVNDAAVIVNEPLTGVTVAGNTIWIYPFWVIASFKMKENVYDVIMYVVRLVGVTEVIDNWFAVIVTVIPD
jgi:hypothetical protein